MKNTPYCDRDQKIMEDKHAWAHYTGVVIVDHLAESANDKPWMARLKDLRWRSLKLERNLPDIKTPPSSVSHGSVMAMLIALHDSVGPKTIGTALNQLDAQNKCRRISRVRYYSFRFSESSHRGCSGKKKTSSGAFQSACGVLGIAKVERLCL